MIKLTGKKVLLIVVCLVIIAGGFVLFMQQPASQPPVRIVMGPFFAHYILAYPLENEFVKPQVELEIEKTLSFNDHMMAGGGDIGEMSTAAFAIAYEKGIPLKAVRIYSMHHGLESGEGVARVFTKNGSGIQTPEDLVGEESGCPWS